MDGKLKLIAVLVSAICLTACGSGESKSMGAAKVGVSSESSTKNSTPIGEEVAQLEKMTNAKDVKNAISMPAQVVLAPTLLGKFSLANGVNLRSGFAKISFGPDQWALFDETSACSKIEKLNASKNSDEQTERLASMCHTNPAAAIAEIKHNKATQAVGLAAVLSLSANQGWGTNPMGSKKERIATDYYMNNYEVAACLTNSVGGLLADSIGKVVMPDPKAISTRADRLFKAIGDDALLKMANSCVEKYPLKNDRTIDLSGTAGAQWAVGNERFEAGSGGMVVTSSGVEMFGKGVFNGRKYDIATSVGSGLSIDSSIGVKSGLSTDHSNGTSSKADVSTGN